MRHSRIRPIRRFFRSEVGSTLVEHVATVSLLALTLISVTNFTKDSIENELLAAGYAVGSGETPEPSSWGIPSEDGYNQGIANSQSGPTPSSWGDPQPAADNNIPPSTPPGLGFGFNDDNDDGDGIVVIAAAQDGGSDGTGVGAEKGPGIDAEGGGSSESGGVVEQNPEDEL